MKKGPFVIGAALALAAGVVVVPDAAWAQRSRGAVASGAVVGGGGGRAFAGGGGRAVVTQQGFAHHPGFPHHPFIGRPFFRPFFPFGIVAAAPAVVYAAPYYYPPPAYYPPAYYDPPVSYGAPVSYTPAMSYAPQPSGTVAVAPAPPPAPTAPPTPSVVQFATGRYELRGDGVSTPYTWVWIPNPPTAPPTAPPASDPGSGSSQAPARAGHLYRWTDAQGVVYWTDRLDAVPEQYRSRAKQTTPS